MLVRKTHRLTLALLCVCVLLLNVACGAVGNTNQQASLTSAINQSSSGNTATISTNSGNTATVSTSCPAAGSGRAAVMPTLHLGSDRTIVFFDNAPSMTLKRYDIETGKTTAILSKDGETIQTAQISNDGQWVLFIMQSSSTSEIQLVRIDGQYLQTLYCAPAGQHIDPTNTTGMQWSPNQKQILFIQGANAFSPLPVYLLTLATGNLQLEMAASPNQFVQLRTWVDNTRVYVTDSLPSSINTPSTMRMLDTSKGANQQTNNLQVVLGVSDTPWNFDSDYASTRLFVTHYDPTPGRAGPGTYCQISSMSITGTGVTTIFHSSTLVVSSLRVLGYGSSSLLLQVNQPGSPSDQYNGIWKVNVDGTGLTRLTDLGGSFNQFTQYPWSNVSRDGSLYLDTNLFGQISGGPATQYASVGTPIGWTTM